MNILEVIARIVAVGFIALIVIFGVISTYLNVFKPWKNKKDSGKSWDIHVR